MSSTPIRPRLASLATLTTIELPPAIGRYRVERLLGQGGMGRVWLARDTVLDRKVAIKVLRGDLALPPRVHDELIMRMRHEARAAAAVSHPNIVTLFDMGEDDTVGLYLVFEYVPGPNSKGAIGVLDGPESLRDRLGEGPLPLAQVAELARELGSALTFAHEAGIVHRDIKPENVLFSRTGSKMADFGIARIPDSTITRQNTVLGTPAYTAPEALATGNCGPASDQFALAATLYEAVTGVRAFGGNNPLETVGRVTGEPPQPIDGRIGSPAVVRALTEAFEKGMAKSDSKRFSSCADLGRAVARAIERPAIGDTPPLLELARDRIHIAQINRIERSPLSSRSALAARIQRTSGPITEETAPIHSSRQVHQRTVRAHNIAAAVSLVVIVLLFLWGRKTPHEGTSPRAAASAMQSASAPSRSGR
ncbi:MAG: serine/threonine protein kinase [Polyangiaceae bacterium]|nr:serine/threonine protein kinase [Polyangiaceae bacterium]